MMAGSLASTIHQVGRTNHYIVLHARSSYEKSRIFCRRVWHARLIITINEACMKKFFLYLSHSQNHPCLSCTSQVQLKMVSLGQSLTCNRNFFMLVIYNYMHNSINISVTLHKCKFDNNN